MTSQDCYNSAMMLSRNSMDYWGKRIPALDNHPPPRRWNDESNISASSWKSLNIIFRNKNFSSQAYLEKAFVKRMASKKTRVRVETKATTWSDFIFPLKQTQWNSLQVFIGCSGNNFTVFWHLAKTYPCKKKPLW